MKKFFVMLTALSAMMLVSLAQAADYYVDVTNRTGYTLYYLYVSPDDSTSWEEDVLGSQVISNGETVRVDLNGYRSPIFDIKAVDNEGDEYIFWNVDVSRQDITVRLDDLVR